ncbi:MAG: glycerate kinase [Synechococcales bacterium]|nr:glycerate kinase [Synechococcales bacterium]
MATQSHSIHDLLLPCLAGEPLPDLSRQQLEVDLLTNPDICGAFGITPETVGEAVERRSQLLRALYPSLQKLCCDAWQWPAIPMETLWSLWLPLAQQLASHHQSLGRPLVQGILGGQGTGKTTLAAILSCILSGLGIRVCCLSIDDLYKTHADRMKLRQVDPRFVWRGPPGTHDVDLGLAVLQQLRQAAPNEPVQVPRFDKSLHQGSGDRTTPETVQGVGVVLFEGWFVGARPIDPQRFDQAPSPIDTDADRAFAREINQRLQAYLPLWDQMDRLMVLYPADYRLSQQWRREAEQVMKDQGKSGMSDAEIEQFVTYFWRSLHPDLFITPLCHDSKRVDLVVEINANHAPGRIYRP